MKQTEGKVQITLEVECPYCQEEYNDLEYAEWFEANIDPTTLNKNHVAQCQKCGEPFVITSFKTN